MQEETYTNQTQFSQEEPLFQAPSVPIDPNLDPLAETLGTKKSKMPLIIGGALFVFVLLIGVLVLMRQKPVLEVVAEPTPIPSPVLAADDPLKLRVKNLQMELDEADPTSQTLVFPPIDMALTLDKIQR